MKRCATWSLWFEVKRVMGVQSPSKLRKRHKEWRR